MLLFSYFCRGSCSIHAGKDGSSVQAGIPLPQRRGRQEEVGPPDGQRETGGAGGAAQVSVSDVRAGTTAGDVSVLPLFEVDGGCYGGCE